MPCPHAGQGLDDRLLSRRSFVRSALAIGGASALSACLAREPLTAVPTGPEAVEVLPDRQHSWNGFLPRDVHGNTVLPYHQLVLLLDRSWEGRPTQEDRERVGATIASVERAFHRGNGGGNPFSGDGSSADGLLFMLGYSPAYFERFDADLPESAGLLAPEEVLEATEEPEAVADQYDAVLVLASDSASVLLATELALFGERVTLNGVEMAGSFEGIFSVAERRTGFVGTGLPRKKLGIDDIPEEAPLSMGYKSGFGDNQASEDAVTIEDGPFAGGTTLQVSRLELDLERWYELDREARAHQMFSPDHTVEQVGTVGESLAADSGLTEEIGDRTTHHAETLGRVGHSQKLAAARDEDFLPRILRRSEGVSTGSPPGFNFTSIQSTVEDFVEVRKAMNNEQEVPDDRSGIVDFLETTNRATFVVPSRANRALPAPDFLGDSMAAPTSTRPDLGATGTIQIARTVANVHLGLAGLVSAVVGIVLVTGVWATDPHAVVLAELSRYVDSATILEHGRLVYLVSTTGLGLLGGWYFLVGVAGLLAAWRGSAGRWSFVALACCATNPLAVPLAFVACGSFLLARDE